MLEVRHIKGEEGRLLSQTYAMRTGAGKVFPTHFKKGEEIHFPLRGHEHFILLIEGKLNVQERNVSQEFELAPHEAVQLLRPIKEEFLDVKTVALEESRVLWVVIHSN